MRQIYRIGVLLFLTLLVACTMQEFRLGEELEQKGDWDGAVAVYREALKKEPFNKELDKKFRHAKTRAAEQHFAQGRKWLKEKKIPEALQEFEIALGLEPGKPEHHTAPRANSAALFKGAPVSCRCRSPWRTGGCFLDQTISPGRKKYFLSSGRVLPQRSPSMHGAAT